MEPVPDIEVTADAYSRSASSRVTQRGSNVIPLRGAARTTSVRRAPPRAFQVIDEYLTAIVTTHNDFIAFGDLHPLLKNHREAMLDEFEMGFNPAGISHVPEDFANRFVALSDAGRAGKFPGYIFYEDSIKASANALGLLAFTTSHVAILAPTQGGKTTIINSVTQMARLYVKNSGRKATVLLVPFGRSGPTEETMRDFEHSAGLGAPLYFKSYPYGTLGQVNQNGDFTDSKPSTKRNTQGQLEDAIQQMVDQGNNELWLVVDEADYASNLDGVLDTFLKRCDEIHKDPKFGGDLPNGMSVRLILVSATGFEYGDIDTIAKIIITKSEDSGYQGLVQGNWIPMKGMSEFAGHIGIPELIGFDINSDYETKVHHFGNMIGKLKTGMRLPLLLNDKQQPFFNGLPFNGKPCIAIRYGKSTQTDQLVKHLNIFHPDLSVIEHFGERLRGKDGRPLRVEDAVKDEVAKGKKCVVILKGYGRRADRFDGDLFGIFIDTTRKYHTAESFYQGLIGRSTGHKDSNLFVLLTDKNISLVNQVRSVFLMTKAETGIGEDVPPIRFQRAFVSGAKVQNDDLAPQRSQFRLVLDQLSEPLRSRLMNNIRQNLQPFVTAKKTGKKDIHGRDVWTVRPKTWAQVQKEGIDLRQSRKDKHFLIHNYIHGVFGGFGGMSDLEEVIRTRFCNPDVRFLMPGVTRADGKRFMAWVNGSYNNKDREAIPFKESDYANAYSSYIEFSFGYFGRNHGGDGGPDRDTRRAASTRGRDRDKKDILEPDVHFDFVRDDNGEVVTNDKGEAEMYPAMLLLHFDGVYRDMSRVQERLRNEVLPIKSLYERLTEKGGVQEHVINAERAQRGMMPFPRYK